jgi:hypothetical protein
MQDRNTYPAFDLSTVVEANECQKQIPEDPILSAAPGVQRLREQEPEWDGKKWGAYQLQATKASGNTRAWGFAPKVVCWKEADLQGLGYKRNQTVIGSLALGSVLTKAPRYDATY